MMGSKERHFAPLIHISLEELVPHDHFYWHLERTLDLSFVRQFVQETYASKGRPSVDPVVFFKLQLVMFFEGLRSERQLMRHAADRLSVLWYLGYDLGEPLPGHSSLTRIRERYGVRCFAASSMPSLSSASRQDLSGGKNSTSMPGIRQSQCLARFTQAAFCRRSTFSKPLRDRTQRSA